MNNEKVEVLLRSIEPKDATTLMELNNSQEISKFVVGTPQSVTLEQQLKWMESLKNETNVKRWIIDFEGVAVGTIILSSIDPKNSTGNMNIKLLPSCQGKGIARASLQKACDIAFDEMDIQCLTAHILPYNEKSINLFEKIGFQKDGVLRSRVVKDGVRYDLLAFSLLKEERIRI